MPDAPAPQLVVGGSADPLWSPIATGRDAADTAFLTSHGAEVVLDSMEVRTVADRLPNDDWSSAALLR